MKRKYELQAVLGAEDVTARNLHSYLCASGPEMCARCPAGCAFGARYLAMQRGEDKPVMRAHQRRRTKPAAEASANYEASVRKTREAIKEATLFGYT